jgi:hypothetical protein
MRDHSLNDRNSRPHHTGLELESIDYPLPLKRFHNDVSLFQFGSDLVHSGTAFSISIDDIMRTSQFTLETMSRISFLKADCIALFKARHDP